MSLKVDLNKDLERKFRQLAMKRFGYSKGSIKKATHLAIELWTRENLKTGKEMEVGGERFVEEFISIPKRKIDKGRSKKII
jgi:hypothetical protein